MIGRITANDLKVKGISAIDDMVNNNDGVIITVRGIEKYVILPIENYDQSRELELDYAIMEAKRENESGQYFTGSIDEHLNRVGPCTS